MAIIDTNTVRAYIKHGATNEITQVAEAFKSDWLGEPFAHCVNLPLKNEGAQSIKNLIALDESLLIIGCINQNTDENDGRALPANAQLYDDCLALGGLMAKKDNVTLIQNLGASRKTALLLIDCYTAGRRLGRHQGVGMARKLCFDAGVILHDAGIIQTKWLRSADADAAYHKGQFAQGVLPEDGSAAGACFPVGYVQGDASDDVYQATLLHQAEGAYFLRGWRLAGYHYWHNAIGSALAVSVEHYCAIGGCPDVRTGEDGKMMYRLSLKGEILEPVCRPVTLTARTSNRCAGGTGRRVTQLIQEGRLTADKVKVHNPECFKILRELMLGNAPTQLTPVQAHECKARLGEYGLGDIIMPVRIGDMFCYLGEHGYPMSDMASSMAALDLWEAELQTAQGQGDGV